MTEKDDEVAAVAMPRVGCSFNIGGAEVRRREDRGLVEEDLAVLDAVAMGAVGAAPLVPLRVILRGVESTAAPTVELAVRAGG